MKPLQFLASALVLWLVPSAPAGTISGVYAFGDSLSDSGNVSLATGGTKPGVGYWNGRYSNGPVWTEYLAARYGLTATASLAGGTNYAFAGARTSGGAAVPSVAQQAAMFIGAGGSFASTDLIAINGGANDFFDGQTDPSVPAASLASTISTLAGAGGRQFVVLNLPDLGDTPYFRSLGSAAANGVSQLSLAYNNALSVELAHLESTLGLDITLSDAWSVGKMLSADPASFGFSNTTDPALLVAAPDPENFLYWDGVHPTTRVHQFLVPEPATASFFVFASGALAIRRRRV